MELVTLMVIRKSWMSAAVAAAMLLFSLSCAKEVAMAPEPPPARGERDRIMSELHGTRKVLLDVLAKISDEKFKAKMGENQPSPSEAVEALIIRERNLLTAMGASTLNPAADPLDNGGLSAEERQKLAGENAKAMQAAIEGCIAKMEPGDFRVIPNPANLGVVDLTQGFRATRDANIAFARETNYNFRRRTIKDDKCGDMSLTTAMMLQSALTNRVAEMVSSTAK
jgi:hypothetical protein